jgi:type II secretory pathway pseudopilin PulG
VENLKRKSVKAYLLLESLITLVLLSILVGVVLSEVVQSRQQALNENRQISALNTAKMAVDSQLTELSVDENDIKIMRNENVTIITNHGEEVLKLEIKN